MIPLLLSFVVFVRASFGHELDGPVARLSAQTTFEQALRAIENRNSAALESLLFSPDPHLSNPKVAQFIEFAAPRLTSLFVP